MALTFSDASFTPELQTTALSSSFTTSSSIAFASNKLYLVEVAGRGDSGSITGNPTLSGGLGTWTLDTQVKRNEFGADEFLYVFRGVDASPSTSALTFTMPASETMKSCRIVVTEVSGSKISGTNGSDGIRSANTTTGSTASGADPYSVNYTGAFASPTNGGWAAFMRVSTNETSTPGSGWTEQTGADGGGGSGGNIICSTVHYRSSEDSSASADYATSGNVRLAVLLEIVEAASGTPTIYVFTHP